MDLFIKSKGEDYLVIKTLDDISRLIQLITPDQNFLKVAYEKAILDSITETDLKENGVIRYLVDKTDKNNIWLENLDFIYKMSGLNASPEEEESILHEINFFLNTITSSLEDSTNPIEFVEKKYNTKITGYHLAMIYKE